MLGDRWLSVARRWLDEGTVARTIEPLIADWRHEVSPGQGRTWPVLRGHLALARSLVSCAVRESVRPLPQGMGIGALLVGGTFLTLGLLIVLALTPRYAHVPVALMIPASLCLALPPAAVPLLIVVRRRWNVEPRTARWLAVRAALVMTASMLALAGWMTPHANEAWRNAAAGRPLPPASREMTIAELLTGPSASSTERAHRIETHNRLSVVFMPISMAALGVATSRRARRTLVGAVAWWVLATALWLSLAPIGSVVVRHTSFEHLASWSPHVVLLLLSCALMARHADEQALVAS